MPVYNGSLYLQRSIGSMMAQTYADWQLVALDDGSTDDSLSVLKQLAAADKRIKIMTKTNDGKGNTARNIDIMSAEAEGDYIFYMSQDDYISADLLQHAVTRAEETGAEIVIPDMLLANADGSTEQAKGSFPPNGDHSILLTGIEAFALCIDFSIHGFALIHRRLMSPPIATHATSTATSTTRGCSICVPTRRLSATARSSTIKAMRRL